MSATETLVATGNQAHSHGPGSPVPLQARSERTTSYDVADFPVPNGREEEWRFTPVKALKALFADEAGTETAEDRRARPRGCRVRDASPSTRSRRSPRRTGSPPSPGTTRARRLAVRIPVEAELTEPVHVNVASLGGRGFGHLVIEAGRHSRGDRDHRPHRRRRVRRATWRSSSATAPSCGSSSIQQGDHESIHVGQHDAVVGRDAKLNHVAVTLGGKIVRLSTNVRYAGPGGDAELLGVYFAEAGQHHENRLFVDHEAINCKSNVLYKGALAGDHARSVWIGDVLIRAAAEGTNTFELNRNLVLTDGARADSVPNLEIETGEIEGAGHASATGRFDDEQLFYLQARGIPEDAARRLVVSGFFNDIIGRIGVPEVTEHLHEVIEQKLARTAELSEAAKA